MSFPSYRPFTQHDRKFGVSAMSAGAGWYTIAALPSKKEKTNHTDEKDPWLLMTFALFTFFGGMLWLVMDSRYSRRPWGKLLTWGGSSGGGASGLSTLLLQERPLLAVAFGMWAWTAAVTLIVFADSFSEFRHYYEHEANREESIPDYAIGTPRDPALYDYSWTTQPA